MDGSSVKSVRGTKVCTGTIINKLTPAAGLNAVYFLYGCPPVTEFLADWVIKLGPATYGPEGQYQYSVVTDNLKATLFVLARDVDVFQRDYEQEVLAFLTEQGFTSALNKPIKTLHNDQCLYNAVPAS